MKEVMKTIVGLLLLGGAIVILLGAVGCTNSTPGLPLLDDDDDDDDSHIVGDECDFIEWEPNDELASAQFVDVLPILGPRLICGGLNTFLSPTFELTSESDIFFFDLYPASEGTVTILNMHVLFKNDDITPRLSIWQTDEKAKGPVFLDSFYGENGSLLLLDYFIEFNELNSHDLIFVIDHVGNPSVIVPPERYTIEYWVN